MNRLNSKEEEEEEKGREHDLRKKERKKLNKHLSMTLLYLLALYQGNPHTAYY